MNNYFITGIGTDVGKTVAAAIVTKALNADYWKPIQSGLTETDRGTLHEPYCPIIKVPFIQKLTD